MSAFHAVRAPIARACFKAALLASAISIATPALAQDAPADDGADTGGGGNGQEIVVVGEISRQIENSLETKRSLDVIGDAIVGEDIGDLPSLSVAEALERVVGVTAARFQGGSTAISVRGLGPFLGASFLNGREVTSGSDGRDVNFSQFPSELINGAIIYKTQQASFVEGGVSGNVELQTLRPLDYNRRRIQAFVQGGYSEAQDRVVNGRSPIETRITGSYIDQFSTGIGEIGIALGGQFRRGTIGEDVFVTSSTYRPCNTIEGIDQSNNCAFDTDDAGVGNGASDTYFVSNQYIFRALSTESDREALLGSIQWQPSPSLDINLDAQFSTRRDTDERANLVIADGRRDIAPIEISSTGALLAWSGESRVENQSVYRQRDEDFLGLGANVEWSGDRLTIATDISYNKTERRQDELDMRIRTADRVLYELDRRGQIIPALTFTDVSDVEDDTGLVFDLNNHDLYTNGARARRRLENVDESVFAVRLDASYALDGFFDGIDFGARYSDRQRIQDDGIDTTLSLVDGGYFSDAAIAARSSNFLVDDLFSSSGSPTTGLTFATFDAQALFTALTGDADAGLPEGSTLSTQDTDVTEKVWAGYVQANFDGPVFGIPATGNVGVRVVHTDVRSVGISSALATSPGADPTTLVISEVGDPIVNVENNSFVEILPSANITFSVADDKLLRFALYRALARPDPANLSAALSFDDEADLADLGAIVSASGNPFLEPLIAWNADVSFEWYASATTSFSLAAYYKNLQTGFETDVTPLILTVDGAPTEVIIGRSVNSNESSDLFGFEVAVQHKFDHLPEPFDGLGVQASYNFADSNFEFPDPTVVSGNALADFTDPANVNGFSKHTMNATAFYETGPLTARVAYRYRSSFFRPFRATSNRFNGSQEFVDMSLNLSLNRNVQLRFQALNVFNEPNVQFRPTGDSLAQTDISGARYFAGVRFKF